VNLSLEGKTKQKTISQFSSLLTEQAKRFICYDDDDDDDGGDACLPCHRLDCCDNDS
jgi:hypothetical protein